ncbi:MAG: DUF2497 domain-containing protein [Zymomonas mobilis subsp. pomaceae]|uniref:DUF2497 domain-containing protein n=1 Tax=Zymomonas mobilis TaxID=542 RepID=UPI0039E7FA26
MIDMRPEPSMEDILASIKRIIADGNRQNSGTTLSDTDRQEESCKHPTQPTTDNSVLELTEPVRKSVSKDHNMDNERRANIDNNTALNGHIPENTSQAQQESLMSEKAEQASRQALKNLSSMMISQSSHQDLTLEALVKEMLRPMLKEWLDTNLPPIVEAMVSREIARITGQHL